MLSTKRVLIATVCGLIFGAICFAMAGSNPDPAAPMTTGIKMFIFFSRGLLGFVIGISAMKGSWWLHGIVLGLITSVPMAASVIDNPKIIFGSFIMGAIIGLLIEAITTKLFKEPSVANK